MGGISFFNVVRFNIIPGRPKLSYMYFQYLKWLMSRPLHFDEKYMKIIHFRTAVVYESEEWSSQ